MKTRLIELLNADKSMAETADMAMYEFGLSRDKHYDVLVVAPGWKPDKIMADYNVEITCTEVHSYLWLRSKRRRFSHRLDSVF